jgi:hypothetical protein
VTILNVSESFYQEKDKLEVLREIGMTNVRITEGATTLNQMTGASNCRSPICKALNPE